MKDNLKSHKMIQEGNCLGFIKNGDGSAGYAIYKQESFISTSDVIYGYADWLNLYTGLFFVASQDLIEEKYNHGYKRNQQHLKGDKVMLPVTDSGEPDYKFMEFFGKKLMLQKYGQYLTFLQKSCQITK
ncbi:Type I restriction modification DNA specificity domain [uncultured Eubacterium sp.]|nr:Type I restriction modification DNA specificity domain [uncultured Eubacterium sp.]